MNKRIISMIISLSIFIGTFPVFAETEIIMDNDESIQTNQTLENLPQISEETSSVFSVNNQTAELPEFPTDETEVMPEIEFAADSVIELPRNVDQSIEVQEIQSLERTAASGTADSDYRLRNINGRDSYALQNQTYRIGFIGDNPGEEYVDSLTGNLTVTETDLVLPGRDGLDLKLERHYSLAEAELYNKTSDIVTRQKVFTLPEDAYVVTETVRNTETGQISTNNYPYFDSTEAERRKREILTRDTNDGVYDYSAEITQRNAGDKVTVNYYYTSELSAVSYARERSNLGAGWSWAFPSVQAIKDNPDDEDEIPKGIYYHDGKGNVFEVAKDVANRFYFTNYAGNDMIFDMPGIYLPDICGTNRIDYSVEDADGTMYYFGTRGELCTIADRFGNKITFEYISKNFFGAKNCPIISRITDTVGRTVNFSYTEVDGDTEKIDITVSALQESGRELTLSYEKKMLDIERDGEVLSREPVLEKVINPIGEEVNYYPAKVNDERSYLQTAKFTFADKTFDSAFVNNTSGYTNNLVYLLGNIVRPTSNTYYNYDKTERNLGQSGVCESYRVEERGELYPVVNAYGTINEQYDKNIVNYEYIGDYTGYPDYNSVESMSDSYRVSMIETRENSQYDRTYGKKDGAVVKISESETITNPTGNNLVIRCEYSDFAAKQPQTTKLTYSNGTEYRYNSYIFADFCTTTNRNYGKLLRISEEMDSADAYLSEKIKHSVSYAYDENTGFVKNKSWYLNEDTKCDEFYKYDSKKRLNKVINAEGAETQYSYEYTSDGKVSKKITLSENDSGTVTTEENYTAETNYLFPSTVVKTVTADNKSTVQTVSYTYDMLLGTVKTMTDNDGNTTYYEYDSIGRPTRIIYPRYSTYTAYDAKNTDILPVETMEYINVSRDYTGKISSGLRIIAQRAENTVKYYDVTGNNSAVPSNDELNELGFTYIGKEIDYYSCGDIIESNVLDKINGNSAYVKTMYYYNTLNNSVKTVDAQGNETTVYYDDLGREVKTVDMFGNSHINEYNISGNGNGFKSMSYFTANGSTEKKNIVEYTYDRQQRVTNKKAYSDYPDSFAEMKYTYDLAGNVVGIIDPNNNLNEDGYTKTLQYDKLNRNILTKNANNEALYNEYDNAGNVVGQSIANQNLYRRKYDGEGKIVSDTNNANNVITYNYNALGQLSRSVDRDGKIVSYEYNGLGKADKITSIKPQSMMSDIRSAYYTPFGAGKVFKMKGEYAENNRYTGRITEIVSTSYTQTGRTEAKISDYRYGTVQCKGYSQYSYDEMGNSVSVVHGCADDEAETVWAFTTNYEYDKNRLSKVQLDGNSMKNAAANAEYEFYADGKLKTVSYPALSDGSVLKSEYVYDGLSRLKSLTNTKGDTVISCYNYTYDRNGNIIKTEETVNGEENSINYTYDKLNRISGVSGSKGADSYYEYDLRGNRKADFSEKDFIKEENAEYRYDENDKLYYVENGDNTAEFEYSVNGYRIVKRENSGIPVFFIYDMQNRLAAEAQLVNMQKSDGTVRTVMYPIMQYIWGADRVLAKLDKLTNKRYYYLYNGHGDAVQIVDTSGNVVNSYDYDVWGNFIEKNEMIDNPFTYFGQTYDETTGLYYLRARYYDPSTGRFTQQDFAEDGYNWYVYGNQNPVMFVDYTGEIAVADDVIIAVAAGVAAASAAIIYMAEHKKKGTTNPANRAKHERGQKRKQNDSFGGEKGDARRSPRKDKRKR